MCVALSWSTLSLSDTNQVCPFSKVTAHVTFTYSQIHRASVFTQILHASPSTLHIYVFRRFKLGAERRVLSL